MTKTKMDGGKTTQPDPGTPGAPHEPVAGAGKPEEPTAGAPGTPERPSPPQTPQEPPAGDQPDGPNREAARYRTERNNARAERDALAERVTALQRTEAERLAAAENVNPAALWATTELADLLTEDGDLDSGRVTAAAKGAVEQLGLEPRVGYVIGGDAHGHPDRYRPGGFLDALSPENRRHT